MSGTPQNFFLSVRLFSSALRFRGEQQRKPTGK
jgi:hypothetical protein